MGRKNSPSAKKQLATLITNYEKAKAENRQLYLDADQLADIADWYASERKFEEAQEVITYGLIGMNIKNAIVLVEQIDLEAKTGKKPLDAVVSATTSRIVPVAMASGTTILGMLPLLFDAMFGGMAATIMGGLLVASALTLFVLPVAYCAIQRIKG